MERVGLSGRRYRRGMLKAFADGTLFGETYGDGRPGVLALHGWGRDRGDFAHVLDEFDAIALDLPGFGASPEPSAAAGAAGYAALVAPVLEDMEQPVTLVGHSFGGRVGVRLAFEYPEAVGALVLTGVPLLRPPGATRARSPLGYRVARWLHRRGVLGEDRMERLRQKHGSTDYRAARGVMRDVLVTAVNETYEEELAAIGCPVEMVWGEIDGVIPTSVMTAAAAVLGGAQVSTEAVPGVGHLLPTESPASLVAAIERCEQWLRRS